MACFVYLCTAGCSVVHYGKMGEGGKKMAVSCVCVFFCCCFIDFLNPAVMQEKNDLGGKQSNMLGITHMGCIVHASK